MFQKLILKHLRGFTGNLAGKWPKITNLTKTLINGSLLLCILLLLNLHNQSSRYVMNKIFLTVKRSEKKERGCWWEAQWAVLIFRAQGLENRNWFEDLSERRRTQRRFLWSAVILIFLSFTGPDSAALREPLKVQVHTMDSTHINFQATT